MSTRTGGTRGCISAGHGETVTAAETILRAGGNAFDAAMAAFMAACVAEPVLASMGGGGFLLAHDHSGQARLYDFFVQSPRTPRAGDLDFRPVDVDFGATTQEFHIGMASIATPGGVRGLLRIHADLCTLPLDELIQPAVRLAREGLSVNALQSYLQEILGPILGATPEARALFAADDEPLRIAREGDHYRNADFAEFLALLAREGDAPFYEGDIARAIVDACAANGGHLRRDDLRCYRVIVREPLEMDYRGAHLAMNPPPSCGGLLIAFGLELLARARLCDTTFGSPEHALQLLEVMALTNRARRDSGLEEDEDAGSRLLGRPFLDHYHELMRTHPAFSRGTTHISVADARGNLASLSLSNGEGSAWVVPGTGVMLNNMLGEEDLNPRGLQHFRPGRRLASMMCPAILKHGDGACTALGSGGSNRLRTAMLQVLVNLLDHDMVLEQAVNCPRMHFERDSLNLEPGFPAAALDALRGAVPDTILWDQLNLFFGGVHAVTRHSGSRFSAGADTRRGGVARVL